MNKLVTKKLNMSQSFLENGSVVPVTNLLVSSSSVNVLDLLNQFVKIEGTSKGKGFTGVMKKWNFSGQQATRGQSDRPRAAGSVGAQTPGRVFLGKKMAGRHGNKKITLKNIRVVSINTDISVISVLGPVPGARNSIVNVYYEGMSS